MTLATVKSTRVCVTRTRILAPLHQYFPFLFYFIFFYFWCLLSAMRTASAAFGARRSRHQDGAGLPLRVTLAVLCPPTPGYKQ